MKRWPLLALALGLVVASLLPAAAQSVISGSARYYLGVAPPSASQSTIRVDTSVTPNRTEIGCETDRLSTTTVNGWRAVGSATGSPVVLGAIGCTGGDTNIPASVRGAGTGGVNLGDNQANYFLVSGAAAGSDVAMAAVGASTDIDYDLTPKGAGVVRLGGVVSTGILTFSAVTHCRSDIPSAQLLPTRIAAGDWALARTAGGGETYNIICTLPFPFRSTASKGVRIDGFSVAHQITVVALTSATFGDLSTVTYANNVANAVADHGGVVTITLPTATQANPYLTAATLGTAAFMVTTNAAVVLEWQVVMANTGVYRLYGVSVAYSTALY